MATVRAMKMNGGVAKNDLGAENVDAVKAGVPTLAVTSRTSRSSVYRLLSHQPFRHRHRCRSAGVKRLCEDAGRRSRFCASTGHWLGRHQELANKRCRNGREAAQPTSSRCTRRPEPVRQDRTDCQGHLPRRWRGRRRKILDQLKPGKSRATASCRSAWPRRSIPSPPIRPCAVRQPGHSVPVREVRLSAGAGFVVRSAVRS